MKKIIPVFLTVLFSCLFSVSLYAIDLPEFLDRLEKTDSHEFANEALGVSARYIFGPFKLDIYIYDLGEKDISDGAGGENVKKAFDAARRDISSMEEKGDYGNLKEIANDMQTLDCLTDKKLDFFHARYTFNVAEGKEILSDLFVTGYNGKFFKLRFSTPEEYREYHDALLKNALGVLSVSYFYYGRETDVAEEIKDSIVNSVAMLEEEPGGKGKIAVPALLKFMEDSPYVVVELGGRSTEWLLRIPKEDEELFTAAFAGGNMREQLLNNICKDMPLAGMRCVLKTYASWKKENPQKAIKALEEFEEMEEDGELEAYLQVGE